MSPTFHKVHNKPRFASNRFGSQDLGQSGYSSLFPVVPHCGGAGPGQFLAKSHDGQRPRHDDGRPIRPVDLFYLVTRSRRSSRPHRRGIRRREELAADRKKLRDDVEREIDVIVAEMHDLLPRHKASAVGIAYARYLH